MDEEKSFDPKVDVAIRLPEEVVQRLMAFSKYADVSLEDVVKVILAFETLR